MRQIYYDHEKEDGAIIFNITEELDKYYIATVVEREGSSSFLAGLYPEGREVKFKKSAVEKTDEFELIE